jgi:hypothetical protein
MKKHLLLASTLLVFAACNKPAERTAVVNSKIASKVFAISEIPEITSSKKAILVSGGENADVKKMDGSLKQTKIEGKADAIIKKITSEAPKADLEKHLKSGAVALVILKDQIKVLKIVADATAPAPTPAPQGTAPDAAKPSSADAAAEAAPQANSEAAPHANSEAAPQAIEAAGPAQELLTMKYLTKLKEHAKSSDARAQAAMEGELAQAKAERPSQIGETYGFIEVASIKVEKFGVLDNERTDYGEKKSLLNVIDTTFELATHLLVGDEIKAKTAGEEGEAAASEEAQ